MSDNEIPLPERVSEYFQQLTTVAAELNAVSDQLGKSVIEIDAALKKLNLGISTWVQVQGGDGDQYRGDFSYWCRDLGYAKIDGKWGISLRKVEGDYNDPDNAQVESWPFNEAPRLLRLEAIDHLPELLKKLAEESASATKGIRTKLNQAQSIADAMNRPPAANPKKRVPPIELVRKGVVAALAEAGHNSPSQLLGSANWRLDDSGLSIEVPGMGKKMLALTINAPVEKVIRQELQRLGGPARFMVVPGGDLTDAKPLSAEAK